MRKIRKQPVCAYNPWNWNLEPGDRVYRVMPELEGAYMIDLRESTGRNKRDAGELTPHTVTKNGAPRLAVLGDNLQWYWQD